MDEKTGGSGKRAAVWVLLLLTSIAGCGLLVWWTAKFHPSNEKMWMVPLCLIMVFMPIIICFSFLSDDVSETLEHLCVTPPPVLDP